MVITFIKINCIILVYLGMGGLKNMTRGNLVTLTNVSVTQDLLGNNLNLKRNIGL